MAEIYKGETKSGFKFSVPAMHLDNYELTEALDAMESNPLAIARVVRLILGEEQKNALLDHVKEKTGQLKNGDVGKELTDIFAAIEPLKNS